MIAEGDLMVAWTRKHGSGPLDWDRTAPRESDGWNCTREYDEATINGWILVAYVGGFYYVTRPGRADPLVCGNTYDGIDDARAKALRAYNHYSLNL